MFWCDYENVPYPSNVSNRAFVNVMHQKFLGLVPFVCFALTLSSIFAVAKESGELNGRIVGGTEANILEFPYQVSLHYENRHICGGAIIGPASILTAAHCVYELPTKSLKIYAGAAINNLGEIYSVRSVVVHPFYDPDSSDYDIAIVKLTSFIHFSASSQPIPLPMQNELVSITSLAVVSGWGRTKENGGTVRALRKTFIPIIELRKCKRLYTNIGTITERMVCAGIATGGKDACQGDSGGPLVSRGKLIGIVSWGYGCARPGYPGVYTKVSKFINWINSKIL